MPRLAFLRAALVCLAALTMFFAVPDIAQAAVPAGAVPSPDPVAAGIGTAVERALGDKGAGDDSPLSLSLQLLVVMGLLTILPALVLMMTSFLRILVVLSILRQALGLQGSPPGQVLAGLALFLSLFVMAPTLDVVNAQAIAPYASGALSADAAIGKAGEAFHAFMMAQTREANLIMFTDMAGAAPSRAAPRCPFRSCCPPLSPASLRPLSRSVS